MIEEALFLVKYERMETLGFLTLLIFHSNDLSTIARGMLSLNSIVYMNLGGKKLCKLTQMEVKLVIGLHVKVNISGNSNQKPP